MKKTIRALFLSLALFLLPSCELFERAEFIPGCETIEPVNDHQTLIVDSDPLMVDLEATGFEFTEIVELNEPSEWQIKKSRLYYGLRPIDCHCIFPTPFNGGFSFMTRSWKKNPYYLWSTMDWHNAYRSLPIHSADEDGQVYARGKKLEFMVPKSYLYLKKLYVWKALED